MSVSARTMATEHTVNQRTALDEKVDHLQSDVDELKSDVKDLRKTIDVVRTDLAEHRIETEKSFGKVREEIGALRTEMVKEIGALCAEMIEGFAKLTNARSADKVWWLIIAGALLGVMAHGFKWI